ncbi:MAG TPA: hypothetical protein VMI54_10625 [Polyangiaceae bacterium]|nr:hypothetical protein [Polyangiaceae bacterium]
MSADVNKARSHPGSTRERAATALALVVLVAVGACAARERDGARGVNAGLATNAPAPSVSRNAAAASPASGSGVATCALSGADLPAALDDFATGRKDAWFGYDDGTRGGALDFGVERTSEGNVLHVTARGFDAWGSGVTRGFGTRAPVERACEVDASSYAGIRFRARGSGSLRVAVETTPLSPRAEGGECDLGQACYDWPGTELELTSTWTTFELPFCRLVPSGWGRSGTAVDPRRLERVHFRFAPHEPHDLWLADLSYLAQTGAAAASGCGPRCPLAAVPPGAVVDPARLEPELAAAGVAVHTFEQPTRRCGPLTRRYLEYLPRHRPAKSAPLLVALHGYGTNAEGFRAFQTHARFEALSEQDGFVVVYGNAAPGAATDPRFPNSGAWFAEPDSESEIDDFDYLRRVRADLVARGEIDELSPTFLVGQSNGGGMVLEAVRANPERYTGFAAFMPYDGVSPALPATAPGGSLVRALFVYSLTDPGLPQDYAPKIRALADAWSRALGVPANVVARPSRKPWPDRVQEGATYAGSAEAALRTRDSHAEELELASGPEPSAAAARYLIFDHAGHFWPNAAADTVPFVLERWGFRNQDLDGADAVWDFFRTALPSRR